MDEIAPEAAMASRRQRFAGSAHGVGSIGFDDSGAFDVGAGEVVKADHEPEEAPSPERLVHPTPSQDRAVDRVTSTGRDLTAPPDTP